MAKLTPVSWKTLVKVFEADGFVFARQTSSHIVMERAGNPRPEIIPRYRELGLYIIRSNMRTAGMTRGNYFRLLERVK